MLGIPTGVRAYPGFSASLAAPAHRSGMALSQQVKDDLAKTYKDKTVKRFLETYALPDNFGSETFTKDLEKIPTPALGPILIWLINTGYNKKQQPVNAIAEENKSRFHNALEAALRRFINDGNVSNEVKSERAEAILRGVYPQRDSVMPDSFYNAILKPALALTERTIDFSA